MIYCILYLIDKEVTVTVITAIPLTWSLRLRDRQLVTVTVTVIINCLRQCSWPGCRPGRGGWLGTVTGTVDPSGHQGSTRAGHHKIFYKIKKSKRRTNSFCKKSACLSVSLSTFSFLNAKTMFYSVNYDFQGGTIILFEHVPC